MNSRASNDERPVSIRKGLSERKLFHLRLSSRAVGKASRKKQIATPSGGPPAPAAAPAQVRGAPLHVAIALALLTCAVFSPVVTHEFINYDDPDYVSANPVVQRGLSAEGVRYAFTSLEPYYWQPLTWLSLQLDVSIAGSSRPAVHLVTNVILHAAAVVLLFLLLQRTTGLVWPSAFAAAVWAVHPLRVESVAWVAERKDVLSTLLFIATVFAYVRFTEERKASRYVVVVIAFALALMAKPMVVTLPVVLFLVDIWPLRIRPTIKDKIPLLILAVAVTAMTFIGQRGAIAEALPLGLRLSNAIVNYIAYLGKMIVPVRLAVIYPYPLSIETWKVAAAAVALLAITAAVVYARRPPLTFGWFWYAVTLLPVIGIIQAGPQSMADRFTYIPSIGIIVAIAFAIPWRVSVGFAIVVALAALSVVNLRYWHDSVTLFTRATQVTTDNPLAHVKLGDALFAQDRIPEASAHYDEAVRVSRGAPLPLAAAGAVLVQQKRYAEAIDPLQRAVNADPALSAARENLGAALMNSGRAAEAIPHFEAALRLDKGTRRAEILQGLGDAKRLAGRDEDGIADLRASIDVRPTAEALNDLGSAYSAKGDVARAEEAFQQSLRINPDMYDAHMNYSALLNREGRNDDAAAHIREAMRIAPDSIEARVYLALVMAASGKNSEAAVIAGEAKRMDARSSNEIFTRALKLAPNEANLDQFIAKMQK